MGKEKFLSASRSAKMLSSYSLTAFLPIWYAKGSLEGGRQVSKPYKIL